MEYNEILQRYFHLDTTNRWTALRTLDRKQLTGFRTSRIGKVQNGILYFTIGETRYGQEKGLGESIRKAIDKQGCKICEIASTRQPAPNAPRYPGFELAACPQNVVETIIGTVIEIISNLTGLDTWPLTHTFSLFSCALPFSAKLAIGFIFSHGKNRECMCMFRVKMGRPNSGWNPCLSLRNILVFPGGRLPKHSA